MFDFNINRLQFRKIELWDVRSWSSPNISKDVLYITGYGLGLHAVNIESGTSNWVYDLGSPRFHLTGVAIDKEDNIIVCSQQKNIHCLDQGGALMWKTSIKSGYDIWGNPTIDPDTGNIYISASYREKDAFIYCIEKKGQIIWQIHINGAIRGSATISRENYIVICCFNGYIYFIDKHTGKIIYNKKFSDAQRALWTSASIDSKGNILFTTKDSSKEGSLICLDKEGNLIWHHKQIGKSLSTPVLDSTGRVYVGTWNGEFICLQT
jgi:outer membrane protein assembly factor BamB